MTHLVVLVIDTEPLPQVSEHHGTVLFELKATRQVFSDKKDTQSVQQTGAQRLITENQEEDILKFACFISAFVWILHRH